MKKRTALEYKLKRRTKSKDDFLKYIQVNQDFYFMSCVSRQWSVCLTLQYKVHNSSIKASIIFWGGDFRNTPCLSVRLSNVNMKVVDHIENWLMPNMLSTINKVVIIILL